ncbi:VWA domain-containing protein [Brevibacillus ruminantium]|uniref:VWA domain-containing protein n=1 Tax=Brevibacillus ruminantium TaxID=2950604 RepID=A0ABY4W867_9BACL|nr:VWA domain-containing protein [Brevibacillus ruminantium]USG63365.1 VWA domain-containing protein [Brevibacillus ruminantium]
MSGFADSFLLFAAAVSACVHGTKVFLFSTHLRRISGAFHHGKAGNQPVIIADATQWGGGMRIGESLCTFVQQYGDRLLRENTVVLIASDGLDTGDPGRLQQAMEIIAARTDLLIWLNPLLDIAGYEPSAIGMKTALPYIGLFTSENQPVSYRKLAERVRLWR